MSLNVVEGPAGGHDAYERAGDDLAAPNYNSLPRVTGNLEGAVITAGRAFEGNTGGLGEISIDHNTRIRSNNSNVG